MSTRHNHERGAISASIFAIIALTILVVAFGSFGIWSYVNYMDQKSDVEGKVEGAVAKAKLEQSTADEKRFAQREKEPMKQFVGPSDYGRLTFDYPKTWSVYQATDVAVGGGVTFQAYLNPVIVPPLTETQKLALRVTIEQINYDQKLASYDKQIKKGELKSSVYTDGTHTGTMLVGNFSKEMISTAILLKMRDRTLMMRTDGDVFSEDYATLLKTVKFNE